MEAARATKGSPLLSARAISPVKDGRSMSLQHAVLDVLCNGKPSFAAVEYGTKNFSTKMPVHSLFSAFSRGKAMQVKGAPGFFAQLNIIAEAVLDHLYNGRGAPEPAEFLSKTRIQGYGGHGLRHYFREYKCPEHASSADSVADSLRILVSSPRYTVVSQVWRTLFTPRPHMLGSSRLSRDFAFDIGIHVRRGDRNYNRTAVGHNVPMWDDLWDANEWGEARVADLAASMVKRGRLSSMARRAPSAFVASDDDDYARRLEIELEARGIKSFVAASEDLVARLDGRDMNSALSYIDKKGAKPSAAHIMAVAVCNESCVPPLLELMERMVHSKQLLVNMRSNVGSFAVASWGAANGDQTPKVADMGGELTSWPKQMRGGPAIDQTAHEDLGRLPATYLCDPGWGGRRGWCTSNETWCSRALLAIRTKAMQRPTEKEHVGCGIDHCAAMPSDYHCLAVNPFGVRVAAA